MRKTHINKFLMDKDDFNNLIILLLEDGYKMLGPKISESAIIYDEIKSVHDFPIGFTDEQTPGSYKIKKINDETFFSYAVGPHSWKKYLFPPHEKLWEAKYDKSGLQIKEEKPKEEKLAFIGVRACELNAIKIQDKVFVKGNFINPIYQQRRENIFIVAVNCSTPAKTCFCTSMNTGPKADEGFDLSLTEILKDNEHYFLIESGSKKGTEILKKLSFSKATKENIEAEKKVIENTIENINKFVNTKNIKELFYKNYENSHWEEVAEKCLACANCTMVCPTCFCSTVEDVTDLTGEHAERWQKWDSCFTMDFSYIHGGSVRSSISSRYRQWITHKFATWIDQFGSSGCVGCGRCITWCPVGIDVTEEIKSLQKHK